MAYRPRPRVNNEIPSMSDWDKDKMFTCPYNQYHRITALVYPGHVAKCRKQYTGTAFARCPFNARHEFPQVEYDYHVSSCPDKNYIERELTAVSAPNVHPLNNDLNGVFNSEEDWESEANHVGFSISGDAYMEPARTAYDEIEIYHDQLEEQNVEEQRLQPTDVSGLSKAQKKNLKRAQKRREKHMANGDTNGDDDDGSEESEELTEAQKDEKLKQIAKEYAIPGRPYNSGAFVDWVSILNIYCQKHRINQPKYSEASNPHGGFGSAVVVTTERFFSDAYCNTKKDAKHSAARAALLGLNIAVSLPDPSRAPHVGARNVVRAREVEQRAAYIESQMTHQPRVIPGFNPAASSSQSSTQHSAASAQAQSVTTQMAGITIQNEDDEWQVAGGRRREQSRPTGNNALRLAGIGRGRARR
ncbi:Hypothetical predicted protein [Paramuricea clavata]|uniref:Uncharacterized protein n=1 Tax=Paramuricea clavata TaxID=317549 RepID=A0A6S7FXN2_PARCT|nr:Hypothetical predicted protein [Paramuricea clavata]